MKNLFFLNVKKKFSLQGTNSSWSDVVGAFPTLWRTLEEFQSRCTTAAKTIEEDLKKVFV
jgi:hypothetical protein